MENKEIIKNLNSTDIKIVVKTLEVIAQKGNKHILKQVINLLNPNQEPKIINSIQNIIENLKEQDCAPVLAESINNESNEEILALLVSACWKNGLSYDEYVETFVEIFIESEFMLAFEAFTVIDNMENISPNKADSCIIRLNNEIENTKEDKKQLLDELIKTINDKKENPAV